MVTIQIISPKELHKRLQEQKDVFVLDVRAEDKFQDYHIENSRNIPKTEIFELDKIGQDAILTLPKNKEIIVTCTTGNSAKKCAAILEGRDYQVTLLEGGLTAWKEYSGHNSN